MSFRQVPSFVLVAAFLLLAPMPALAWGAEGHEIAADIAWRELQPAARLQVAKLLGNDVLLVQQSNWADEIKDRRRDTAAWHFVDIPLGARGFVPQRDCRRGDCVVAEIEADVQALRNRRLSKAVRTEALLFLIHFVADVHQPLHAEDNGDKGGNQVRVEIGRERANLHRVWDVDVVEAMGFDSDAVAAGIEHGIKQEQRRAWSRGTPADWANEAHAIARDQIYPPLQGTREIRLPRDYAWRAREITRLQLAKAGVRLAFLLNTTLR